MLICAIFAVLLVVPIRRHLSDGLYGIPLIFFAFYATSLISISLPRLRVIPWLALFLGATTICLSFYMLMRNSYADLVEYSLWAIVFVVPALLVGAQIALRWVRA